MSSKISFIAENKDKVKFGFMRCINDSTLRESYFVVSNVFCDGLNFYTADHTNTVLLSKKKCKAEVNKVCQFLNKKPRLVGTDNSLGFTRLIYDVM